MKITTWRRVFVVFLFSGCAAQQTDMRSFLEKGYSVTGRDPFRFEVDPQKLREWGGPGSREFNRVLDEELERQKICRKGYTLRNEHLRDGVFTVVGRCRS